MRKILIVMTGLLLLASGTALGEGKFPNKDTAKNRRDSSWGTGGKRSDSTTTMGTDAETGDSTIVYDSGPKKEPVDWYDKIIITVDPQTRWPSSGSETSTTSTYNNSTDTEVTTSTTNSW